MKRNDSIEISRKNEMHYFFSRWNRIKYSSLSTSAENVLFASLVHSKWIYSFSCDFCFVFCSLCIVFGRFRLHFSTRLTERKTKSFILKRLWSCRRSRKITSKMLSGDVFLVVSICLFFLCQFERKRRNEETRRWYFRHPSRVFRRQIKIQTTTNKWNSSFHSWEHFITPILCFAHWDVVCSTLDAFCWSRNKIDFLVVVSVSRFCLFVTQMTDFHFYYFTCSSISVDRFQ